MIDKPSHLTPPDANKKIVNEVLRHVDVLIRERNYAKAFLEIQRAKTMDPKNPYVLAYEERMSVLIEEKKQSDLAAEKKKSESPVPAKPLPVQPPPVRTEGTAVPAAAPRVPPVPPVIPILPHTQSVDAAASHGGHEMIRHSEHDRLAKRQYTVMLVDDDKDLLFALAETMKSNDFHAAAFDTTDEAFRYLQKGELPDIIVCDINLETSSSGGFDFYERLRLDEKFSMIPFIFLSGLTDDVVVRTGKELGADDYLTKPVSENMLMATIKGKLKRFQRLNKLRS